MCFKESFTTLKAYINLFRGLVQYFETSWYNKTHLILHGIVSFNVTSTGNSGCFRKSFAMVFQMLLCGESFENVYT
jgi:hypothetical protein